MPSAKPQRKVLRDNIQGVTKPAIQRLANTAGIVEMSGQVYDEVRLRIKDTMESILKNATAISQYARRKRVQSEDIVEGIRLAKEHTPFLHAILTTGKEGETARCQVYESDHKTTDAIRRIKHYQSQHDCVQISRKAFDRLTREVAQDYKEEATFSANAVGVLQMAIEAYVINLLAAANLAAIHADRKTVMPKDVLLALSLASKA